MSIELISQAVFEQRINYIRFTSVIALLYANPEGHIYSSARFYYVGTDNIGRLTHYSGN